MPGEDGSDTYNEAARHGGYEPRAGHAVLIVSADALVAVFGVGRCCTGADRVGATTETHEIPLLRARAAGPCPRRRAAYRDYRDRYRAMAKSLGFEGHMKWAEAMP